MSYLLYLISASLFITSIVCIFSIDGSADSADIQAVSLSFIASGVFAIAGSLA